MASFPKKILASQFFPWLSPALDNLVLSLASDHRETLKSCDFSPAAQLNA